MKNWLLVLLLIIIAVGIFLFREDIAGYISPSPTPTITSTSTPTATYTITPSPIFTTTPTPTPTQTPTTTPSNTPTLTPRIWTFEEFEKLISAIGIELLDDGWHLFDGEDVFEGYPFYPYFGAGGNFKDVFPIQMEEAYEKSNDANHWCKWAVNGYINNFGSIPDSGYRRRFWERVSEALGNPDKEPYCRELDHEYLGLDPTIEHYSLDEYFEPLLREDGYFRKSRIPSRSIGLTDQERSYLINQYFIPLSNKMIDDFLISSIRREDHSVPYPYKTSFTQEQIENISNTDMCYGLANHIAFALDAFNPYQGMRNARDWYETLVEYREFLSEDLKDICPDFLSLVEPFYYPHPDYLPKENNYSIECTPTLEPNFQFDPEENVYELRINDSPDIPNTWIDVLEAHYLIQEDELTVILTLWNIPDVLPFYRQGVCDTCSDYLWGVYIDTDNDISTGIPQWDEGLIGWEYMMALTAPNQPDSQTVFLAIAEAVEGEVRQENGAYSYRIVGKADFIIDPEENTITITGLIPGINHNSLIEFFTFDYNPHSNSLSDHPDP